MNRALALLRQRRRFRRLWSALALSYIGSGAATTALTLYVQQTHGTGAAVAALLIASTAPRLLGPLAGGIADRVDVRRLMILCDLGQALLFALIALLPPFGVLLGLTALAFVLQTAYGPARTAALPALVGEDELLTANALLGLAPNLYVAIGPLIGGTLFALGGTSAAILVNAATFLASAQLTRGIPSLHPQEPEGGHERLFAAARTALHYVWNSPVTRTVTLAIFFMLAFIAIDNVALVFLIRDTLGGGGAAFGIVEAAFGIGMIAGSLLIVRGTGLSAPTLFLLSMVLSSGASLLVGLAPSIAVAAVIQMVGGAGNGIDIVASDTVIQQHVPRALLGRVYGLTWTAGGAGLAVSMAIGGLLVELTTPRVAFVAAGAGGLLVTACAAPPLLRAGREPLPVMEDGGR